MNKKNETHLTWEQVVKCAEVGDCWVCGRSGFVKLAQHLAMKHGLHADQVRERYGIAWTQPLCSPEFTEANRRRYYELDLEARMRGLGGQRGVPRRPPRKQGAQARKAMSEVANRPEVKKKLAARNRDPEFNRKRAEGLKRSEAAERQRAAARASRWRQQGNGSYSVSDADTEGSPNQRPNRGAPLVGEDD